MKALIDSIKLEIRHHRQQLQAKYIQNNNLLIFQLYMAENLGLIYNIC